MPLSPFSQIARIQHLNRIVLQTDTESFCGLAEGFWSSAATEAWPAARIMASAAAPAEKRDDMKMTSNLGRALAEENGCLQSRWTRRNAIQRRTHASAD